MEEEREEYIKLFEEETREYLNQLESLMIDLEKEPGSESIISEIYRIFHTIKGMAASLDYKEIEAISHNLEEKLEEVKEYGEKLGRKIIDRIFSSIDKIENLLDKIRNKESSFLKITLKDDVKLSAARAAVIIKRIETMSEIEEIKPTFEEIKFGNIKKTFRVRCSNYKKIKDLVDSMEEVEKVSIERKEIKKRTPRGGIEGIRVNVELLDHLQNLVGELAVSSSRLSTILKNFGGEKFRKVLEVHNRTVKELQEIVSKMRLVPLSLIFNKFSRYVRDLSRELGKKVTIDIFGSDIEVDRSLLESISDPLIHLIRNAVSHGIEPPRERKKLNKSTTGKVTVSAKRVKGDIVIEVSDDGRGIDRKEVLLTAFKKGLVSDEELESLSKKEILRFLFIPGFTTRGKVSKVSGRGVGLDVVKEAVRSVGGSVELETEKNKGTTVTIKMPLSMAIIKVYLVGLKKQLFAIPMRFVDETLMISKDSLSYLMGREMMLLRKEVLPVYRFSNIMEENSYQEENHSFLPCVVVEMENERFALIVDSFRGSTDAVVKPLPFPINNINGYTGITIIGKGEPCLILDLPGLKYRKRYENTGS
ncbi:MAG: chemotaxis protein CheA [candidate division WOR-3 bacterium]|nr:chemotaxis protein CheA [candidate division WOR-3 bacterium]